MIELPYGIADFRSIRQEGLVYVDRTAHIRDLERLGPGRRHLPVRRAARGARHYLLGTSLGIR